jgi:hypothetical protein
VPTAVDPRRTSRSCHFHRHHRQHRGSDENVRHRRHRHRNARDPHPVAVIGRGCGQVSHCDGRQPDEHSKVGGRPDDGRSPQQQVAEDQRLDADRVGAVPRNDEQADPHGRHHRRVQGPWRRRGGAQHEHHAGHAAEKAGRESQQPRDRRHPHHDRGTEKVPTQRSMSQIAGAEPRECHHRSGHGEGERQRRHLA